MTACMPYAPWNAEQYASPTALLAPYGESGATGLSSRAG